MRGVVVPRLLADGYEHSASTRSALGFFVRIILSSARDMENNGSILLRFTYTIYFSPFPELTRNPLKPRDSISERF